ncbi:MAG TPA: Z1 domain-containing protein, partial [Candidatus Paceibacterota bacterium]|nr:Z1 domain-containing protein [Candidatus Paceibacterota bacterium]
PESIRRAIRSFVLANAARIARGHVRSHNSMLIHVTRFTAVQQQVRDQVDDELRDLRARVKFGDGDASDVREELRELWDSDFAVTSSSFSDDRIRVSSWKEIEANLDRVLEPIVVKTINGTAQDALDYFEHRSTGLNVIAIGGDKLSRGLTLEGLTVSYYLRASRAYDTLLQMGRWFGYRDDYQDLCRLWTTPSLWQAYKGISDANEELIQEFEDMAARGASPRDYGLKVRNSVAGMIVTAPSKMRAAKTLRIGFSGSLSETVVLYCDRSNAETNLTIADDFIRTIDAMETSKKVTPSGNHVWTQVPGITVANGFFSDFRTPEAAWKVNAPSIAAYIRNRVQAGELIDWTVVLISVSGGPNGYADIAGKKVGLTRRAVNPGLEPRIQEGFFSIRRILSGPDEFIDFSDEEVEEALVKTRDEWEMNPGGRLTVPDRPSGRVIRHARPPTRGLLLLYPLAPPPGSYPPNIHLGPMLGFAVSFPQSPAAPMIDYVVNRRFLEDLYGEVEE